jgi:hypothetical protein
MQAKESDMDEATKLGPEWGPNTYMTEASTDDDEGVAGSAPAPNGSAGERPPSWVDEGTRDEDTVIKARNIGGAKAMGPREEWIPAAKGVRMRITKAVLEERGPKGGDWKVKMLTLYLAVADGIVYPPTGSAAGRNAKSGDKPDTVKFKGKMFFQRCGCDINEEGTDKLGTPYNFTTSAAGKPTDYYSDNGSFWGEYKEALEALGFPTNGTLVNNKAWRQSLEGRFIVYDIEKEKKQDYDAKTGKRSTVPGEFENKLYSARAAAAAASPKPAAAAPVAAAVPVDDGTGNPWGE